MFKETGKTNVRMNWYSNEVEVNVTLGFLATVRTKKGHKTSRRYQVTSMLTLIRAVVDASLQEHVRPGRSMGPAGDL